MRILCNILVVLFVTATAVGQQINPVPDYIFRNSMSVGRNAPTDTSAYFSIGPRFGATRGFMPPMVTDTASVTGTKRNGLLIYSIQRNSFLYWDSTGSRWSRIAANLDTLLLSTRAWRQKGDDSLAAIINTRTDTVNLLSTKAWRQKGIDSVAGLSRVGGSGTINRVPKFTASGTIGDGSIADSSSSVRMTILSNGRIGIGTATPGHLLDVRNDRIYVSPSTGTQAAFFQSENTGGTFSTGIDNSTGSTFATGTGYAGAIFRSGDNPISFLTNNSNRMRIQGNGRVAIGTVSDNGFLLEVNGTFKSGNVSIGTAGDVITGTGNWIKLQPSTGTEQSGYQAINTGGQMTIGIENSAGGSFNTGTAYAGAIWRSGSNPIAIVTNSTERLRVTGNGETLFGTTSDAGDFRVQVSGAIYNTTGPNHLNVTSGNTGIGLAVANAPSEKLHVNGRVRIVTIDSSASPINMLWADNNGVVRKAPVPTASVSGGTTDFIPLWSSSTALTSSVIKQVSSEILVDYASDQGAFKLQVNGAALADGGYQSGAPNGGTAATWKLGIVVAGSYTAASNYLQVDVGGTLYYIGLVTPN